MSEELIEGPDGRFGKYRNKERQDVATIGERNGEYYVWFEPINQLSDKLGPVRKEYPVMGNRLVHPKKWGRRKAGKLLVQTHIEDQKKIIQRAQEYLAGLEILLSEIEGWPDDELETLERRWDGQPAVPKQR